MYALTGDQSNSRASYRHASVHLCSVTIIEATLNVLQFKIPEVIFKVLNGLGPSYIWDHLLPMKTTCPVTASLLMVPQPRESLGTLWSCPLGNTSLPPLDIQIVPLLLSFKDLENTLQYTGLHSDCIYIGFYVIQNLICGS